jgi:hypothetical protein
MLNMLGPAGARMDRKSAYHVDIDRQLRQGAPHPVSMELDYVQIRKPYLLATFTLGP